MGLDVSRLRPVRRARSAPGVGPCPRRRQDSPRAAEVNQSGEFPWDVHEALAKAELTAEHIPEAYGGAGADAIATVIVIEEVARRAPLPR